MDSTMATVLVIGTLDTKGPESAYLAQRIRDNGCHTLLLDSGILGEADGVTPDLTRQQVAIAAGSTIEQLRNAGGSRVVGAHFAALQIVWPLDFFD